MKLIIEENEQKMSESAMFILLHHLVFVHNKFHKNDIK